MIVLLNGKRKHYHATADDCNTIFSSVKLVLVDFDGPCWPTNPLGCPEEEVRGAYLPVSHEPIGDCDLGHVHFFSLSSDGKIFRLPIQYLHELRKGEVTAFENGEDAQVYTSLT